MITTIKDKPNWIATLKEIGTYDFHHTYDYHALSVKKNEQAILIEYRNEHKVCNIALPLLIRPIDGTLYFDASSVYGYGGPISCCQTNETDFLTFQKELQNYFKEQKIISVFSRLHPYITKQENILRTLGHLKTLGKVVNIDIKLPEDQQLRFYSKTTKRYLKKIRQTCSVTIENNTEAIHKFIALYEENMHRVNAKPDYFFPKEYYLKFAEATDFKTEFVFVVLNDTQEIISGAMIIYTNTIVQYHLSGTLNDYLHLTPIRLILDEIRVKASKEGYQIFNLGGGLGSQEDSLFNFKASFSKEFRAFKVWNYISNQDIYEELCSQNEDINDIDSKNNFFPRYRYKKSEKVTV